MALESIPPKPIYMNPTHNPPMNAPGKFPYPGTILHPKKLPQPAKNIEIDHIFTTHLTVEILVSKTAASINTVKQNTPIKGFLRTRMIPGAACNSNHLTISIIVRNNLHRK